MSWVVVQIQQRDAEGIDETAAMWFSSGVSNSQSEGVTTMAAAKRNVSPLDLLHQMGMDEGAEHIPEEPGVVEAAE